MSSSYHHGALRESLIDVATSSIREHGANALTLRAICGEIGVSAAAAYRHFCSKDELLKAVAHSAAERLLREVKHASTGVQKGSNESITILCFSCISFAKKDPAIFKIMIEREEWPGDIEKPNELIKLLESLIALRTEPLDGANTSFLTEQLLSMIYGASCIVTNKVHARLNAETSLLELTGCLIDFIFSQIPPPNIRA